MPYPWPIPLLHPMALPCAGMGSLLGLLLACCEFVVWASDCILCTMQATLQLWHHEGRLKVTPAEHVQTLHGHEGAVTCVAVAGDLIISGGRDCSVRVWQPSSAAPLLAHPHYQLQVVH
jgi:hypothetical protein